MKENKIKLAPKVRFKDDSGNDYPALVEKKLGDVFSGSRGVGLSKDDLSDIVTANNYNLSVNSYVETQDTREVIDITNFNTELKITAAKINKSRSDIDSIIMEIKA